MFIHKSDIMLKKATLSQIIDKDKVLQQDIWQEIWHSQVKTKELDQPSPLSNGNKTEMP